MNRKGYLTDAIATQENYIQAFLGFSRGKNRAEIRRFAADLYNNLAKLRDEFVNCEHVTAPYEPKDVFIPKHRMVCKSPITDHVSQWAAMLPVEQWLMDTFYHRCPSCVPKKGTHYFVRQEMAEMRRCSQDEVYYGTQIDVHHYFNNIDHWKMEQRVHEKFKDPVLVHFLLEFIYSFGIGLVLGVKLSQMLSGLYLAPFDRLALRCFGIGDDVERYHYWRARYVTDCFVTCRTKEQASELAKGVDYLNAKFDRYVTEGLRHYSRFADNIIIKHRDKAFLRLMIELAIMILARDYHLPVNKGYTIKPMYLGIDVCGYVFYHDHLRLRKRNKKGLCRQVARLRKKGYDTEQIQRKCASRIGFAGHADTRYLLKSLGMERLGTKIKNRKQKAPFIGMSVEQKLPMINIICSDCDNEDDKLIQLIDYAVDESVIEKNDDGSPKQRIALRYKLIDYVEKKGDNIIYHWLEEEHYSFSGSKVMIEQAVSDFSKGDLPTATVIKEFVNKQRKKFYKFT